MSTAAERAPRSIEDLAPADRDRLKAAHARLRDATRGYERFLGTEFAPGEAVPVHGAREMAAAQLEVQRAEDDLWHLRKELLGWARPSWAPKATLVSDWFSDEDQIYDNA